MILSTKRGGKLGDNDIDDTVNDTILITISYTA